MSPASRALVLAMVLAMPLAASSAQAQSKTGTTVAQFMQIEPDARIAAMGMAGSALDFGIETAYFNPATVALLERYEARFTHAAWLEGISYDYVAVGIPLGKLGSSLLSVTALNSGDIAVRTVSQPFGTGEQYSVTDIAIGVGYGLQVTDRVSAGGQFNFIQETIWHSTASTVTVNLGTLYRISANGLRLGASLTNFGTSMHFTGRDLAITYDNDPTRSGDNGSLPGERSTGDYPLPLEFRVGVAQPWSFNGTTKLLVAAEAAHPSDNTESVSLGAELELRRIISLRAGYQNLGQQDSEVGPTLGAGIQGRLDTYRYRVDYAWADQGRLEGTHRISLGVTF
ncbi:MAG: PorV/PorQ family protein [Candidatus Eiseniibacteriota bacterium]